MAKLRHKKFDDYAKGILELHSKTPPKHTKNPKKPKHTHTHAHAHEHTHNNRIASQSIASGMCTKKAKTSIYLK